MVDRRLTPINRLSGLIKKPNKDILSQFCSLTKGIYRFNLGERRVLKPLKFLDIDPYISYGDNFKAVYGVNCVYNGGMVIKFLPYIVRFGDKFKRLKLKLGSQGTKGIKFIGLRKCSICKRSIKVYKEKIGNIGGFKTLVSNEGVLYYNSWFCNRCSLIVMSKNKMVRGKSL